MMYVCVHTGTHRVPVPGTTVLYNVHNSLKKALNFLCTSTSTLLVNVHFKNYFKNYVTCRCVRLHPRHVYYCATCVHVNSCTSISHLTNRPTQNQPASSKF